MKEKVPPVPDAKVIADLLAGERDVTAIATQHFGARGGLCGLAAWARRPRIANLLEALGDLLDRRGVIALAQGRVLAARTLSGMAADAEGGETARKACVDLLRVESPMSGARGARPERASTGTNSTRVAPAGPGPVSPEAIRRLLDHLSAADAPPARDTDDTADAKRAEAEPDPRANGAAHAPETRERGEQDACARAIET